MLEKFGLIPTKSMAVLPGDLFGRLRVIATGQIPGKYRYMAVCECECGSAAKTVRFDLLKSGATLSCGCLRLERTSTHHMRKSVHYDRWHNMMDRCYRKSCPAYQNYGGRGIKVCPAWHDIVSFVNDLPDGYAPGLEMDRIDNDGDYKPGNIRWATRSENCDNRRTGASLTHKGKTQSFSAWSKETGINLGTLWTRINSGWSAEKALTVTAIDPEERMAIARQARWGNHTKKPKPKPAIVRTVEYDGHTYTLSELSDVTGISHKLLYKRIFERGWPISKAVTS